MEYYAIKLYKVNIEELDKKTSLQLFITHYCGYQDYMPHKLVEVSKNIVKT